MPVNVSCSACILVEYAFTALCTPRKLDSIDCIPSDRASKAASWFAQIVSPP